MTFAQLPIGVSFRFSNPASTRVFKKIDPGHFIPVSDWDGRKPWTASGFAEVVLV